MAEAATGSPLVLLTEAPSWTPVQSARRRAIRALEWLIPRDLRPPLPEPLGGHYAVTRSVVAGLRKLDVAYLYNPPLDGLKADVAIVLSSPQVVAQALEWKRKGGCRRLLAGPNIAVMPVAEGDVLRSPSLDGIIVPSEWVGALYAEVAPDIGGRILVHAAGVDEEYWSPRVARAARRDVLVYDKMMPAFADEVARSIEAWGFSCDVIRYGAYAPQQFRRALDRARVCVALTESESQGIALAEAWAMDVPTLVLHRDRRVINGRDMRVSTAPYLGPQTGRFWSSVEELRALLAAADAHELEPRAWVLAHMTDRIAAKALLQAAAGRPS
jgi:hypothetical protein